jgi:predicted TIM-barrel fold metal-dependent hydrolase
MKIVDAHIHLWNIDSNPYPWLTGPDRRGFFGDNSGIRRNFQLPDLDRDIGMLDVTKVVHVQANWDTADPVAETRWLNALRETDPLQRPNAIVAFADLSLPSAQAVIEAHLAVTDIRGIRQTAFRPILDASHPDYLGDPTWRKNVGLLKNYGLSFDLMIFPQQFEAASKLIASNPDTLFLLEHCGCPQIGDDALMHVWRSGMRLLADLPNVVLKISGLGMFDWHWDASSAREIILFAIDAFGARRTMFGSNFPVDSLMNSYAHVWNTFITVTADYSADDKRALFSANAEKYYRI